MQHLLRAISGPLAGATYVLGRRTTIGRASDCDIQIVHEGVSRHHAKITQQDDGGMVVADLSSDNGTFVDTERIQRHRLEPGQEVRIMRSRFTYEHLENPDLVTSAAFRRKITSGDSLRQTADHGRSLAARRAGMAKGLPGAMAAAAGRPHSPPRAAASAPSGGRPGTVAGSSPDPSDDSCLPAASPHQTRKTSPTQETPPPEYTGNKTASLPRHTTGASLSIGTGVSRPEVRRPEPQGSFSPSGQDGSGAYGWHADGERRGRRERIAASALGRASEDRWQRHPAGWRLQSRLESRPNPRGPPRLQRPARRRAASVGFGSRAPRRPLEA